MGFNKHDSPSAEAFGKRVDALKNALGITGPISWNDLLAMVRELKAKESR